MAEEKPLAEQMISSCLLLWRYKVWGEQLGGREVYCDTTAGFQAPARDLS